MRPGLTLLCVLALPLLGRAADEDKVLTALTPQEVEEGWILLFDGETTFGWHSPNESRWTISKGMLAPQAGKMGLLLTTSAFRDYELRFEYQARKGGLAQVLVGCKEDVKPRKYVEGGTQPPQPSPATQREQMFPLESTSGGWNRVRMTVTAGMITEATTKGPSFSFRTGSGVPSIKPDLTGRIALAGNGVVFRNMKLKPLGMKPLLNGKDLAGWKEFRGQRYKSKFTVTNEGWLNIKNGPGDLQTEGQWADFVLQLDCISNAEYRNSGVFFRCQPSMYQQGYEAQIHNNFTVDPPKEYTVKEYDPKTHELTGEKKVKSAAKDYGTGAIYRRVPARRPMAKDREWFTMTVVANGRHLATWVNGIQEVDWTDNRPLNDNAREGCRLEKGPISLQGHDPTTDLSFRNIRIEDLSPGKAGQKNGR